MADIWIVSDARNGDALQRALSRLPRGSGVIYRHYHLKPDERRKRFAEIARLCRRYGHSIALSGTAAQARQWGADGAYGSPRYLSRGPALLRLATAHTLREIAQANRSRASAVLLSPAFPTRSHPGATSLGPLRFRLMAARSRVPVIALGGMNAARARRLGTPKWAAIQAFA